MRLSRSPSWVTKVERGVHAIDSITTLRQIAGVFNVPVAALTDEPTQVHNAVVEPAAGLVRVLDRPPMMLPAVQQVRSLPQLAHEVVALRRVYNRSSTRFLTAATVLPELIIEAAALARGEPAFTTTHVNAENLPQILCSHWSTVTVEFLDGELRIPADEYASYFAANIPTWDRAPAPEEEADILRRVDQWARADQHEGQIVEHKRVALATCLADGDSAAARYRCP